MLASICAARGAYYILADFFALAGDGLAGHFRSTIWVRRVAVARGGGAPVLGSSFYRDGGGGRLPGALVLCKTEDVLAEAAAGWLHRPRDRAHPVVAAARSGLQR